MGRGQLHARREGQARARRWRGARGPGSSARGCRTGPYCYSGRSLGQAGRPGQTGGPAGQPGRAARPGRCVLLLDDVGNWRGLGTAWHLAENHHEVTIVTPDPLLGRELVRTSADIPLRAHLAKLGVRAFTESVVTEWHGDGASIR